MAEREPSRDERKLLWLRHRYVDQLLDCISSIDQIDRTLSRNGVFWSSELTGGSPEYIGISIAAASLSGEPTP